MNNLQYQAMVDASLTNQSDISDLSIPHFRTPATISALRTSMIMITASLIGLGMLMVYSSSVSSNSENMEFFYAKRHITWLTVGILACLITSFVPARFWKVLAIPLFILSLGLLITVLIPGIGSKIRGSQRWIRWGSMGIQPSEFTKITLILSLARIVTLDRFHNSSEWAKILWILVPTVSAAGLVVVQPDFGTSIFLLGTGFLFAYLSNIRMKNLIVLTLFIMPLLGLLLIKEPYRLKRLTGYIHTWSDQSLAPYHTKQSLISLGSGGLQGKGIGKGWQKLSYLPEANNDFVFAVIGEEMGLVGTLTVVILWGAFVFVGWQLAASTAHIPYQYMVVTVLVFCLTIQAIINLAVVTALIPAKGIPLPFISYGGSSLFVSLVSIGIILGFSRNSYSERTLVSP
ncbi:MAG: putative lipid II flippase FtsW [Planctomycetota bacterium]|nr:putative lipid II flippase FtsW [Planctomycetota bacterium]